MSYIDDLPHKIYEGKLIDLHHILLYAWISEFQICWFGKPLELLFLLTMISKAKSTCIGSSLGSIGMIDEIVNEW